MPLTHRKHPFFSIIIPTHNRCGMLGRVLASCFKQNFGDFEIIVIDDASTDNTIDTLRRQTDSRVRVVRTAENGGPSRARNVGIDSAQGSWCVMLDSDFELVDDALDVLASQCLSAPSDVGNVANMCIWDAGPDTPFPEPRDALLLDYAGFLRFLETLRISEWFNCVRREVFNEARYPDARASEGTFHLALAQRWRFQLTKERLIIIHTDAPNRITSTPMHLDRDRMRRDALELAAQADSVLTTHGEAMRRHAPTLHAKYRTEQVYYLLIGDRRREALSKLRNLGLRRVPASRALQFALGFASPQALVSSKALASSGRRMLQNWRGRRG